MQIRNLQPRMEWAGLALSPCGNALAARLAGKTIGTTISATGPIRDFTSADRL